MYSYLKQFLEKNSPIDCNVNINLLKVNKVYLDLIY